MNSPALMRRLIYTIAAAWLCLGATTILAAPEGPHLATAVGRELWRKGSDQVLAGDFVNATKTLEKVRQIEPDDGSVASALDWMHNAQRLAASRESYRAQMYDYYVKKAQTAANEARGALVLKRGPKELVERNLTAEDLEKIRKSFPAANETLAEGAEAKVERAGAAESEPTGDAASEGDGEDAKKDDGRYQWSRALLYAQSAMANAVSEDAFRKEPWLADIVKNAKLEITRHKAAEEWRDSLALYDILKRIYPDVQEYKDGIEFCRKRAHLGFIYGKKSTWKTDLADVTPDAVRETLARIADDYVEEPDFRKLCRDGLEHLILLAQADSLTDTFESLGELDLVARFVNRLNGLLRRRVEGASKFGERQVRSVFRKVLSANRDTLRLPVPVVVDEFVAGMLEPLDAFTNVIWPAEVTEFNKQTRGEFVGVGIQITQEPGHAIRIETPLEDSPAYQAGVKPGDLITKVDGKSTLEMTITQAVRAITGEPGTIVVLTIEDPTTGETIELPLKRSHIKIHTVRGTLRDENEPTGWNYFIDPELNIGYVRVSGFMDKTVDDLEKALDQLHDEGCRGLILDLRFNPGGLLTSAINMCELFLDEDDPIVQTKGRSRQQNMTIRAKSQRRYADMPLIIMVNQYSASASEIVAGALSGLKEACVVGTRSFGKGSVQNLIPIMDSQAYLKLTTAHYYVPDSDLPESDQWYLLHRKPSAETWGVEPHVQVKLIPQEVGKILRLRRERDVLKGRNQAAVPKEILERRPTSKPTEEFPEDPDPDVDPQLVMALNIMRMKLVSNQPWALAPRLERTLSVADSHQSIKQPQKQQ